MTDQPAELGRRNLLKGALAAPVAAMLAQAAQADERAQPPTAAPHTAARPRLIADENAREGARNWQLTRVRVASEYRSTWIEGYCSRQSVAAGQTIDIMVSVDPPVPYQIEVFRLGYYGGRGARHMTTIGPLQGRRQPTPEEGPRRLIECRWEPTTTLTIPADWPSGVYLGRLSRLPPDGVADPWQSYVVFIVRDNRPVDVLFQCSDNTWQAYNRWPIRHSLYDDGSPREWTVGPGVDVSFDRPYGKYRQIFDAPQSVGSGEFLLWEFPLAYWLEQQGYDVSYCSNSDMIDPQRVPPCKTFLSVGHDEYWDVRQYDVVKQLIDGGTNAMFLSGNSVCWMSPFTASSDGRPNRMITREGPFGGRQALGLETRESFDAVGPDEGLLMGARNVIPINGGGDWIVTRPDHWMFAGTGMKAGDFIPGLVGWEFHGAPPDIPGLEVVAEGTALSGGIRPQRWTATIYPGPKGNFVFNAATIYWAQAMSSPPGHMLPWSHWTRPHGPDDRVQRIMRNLLDRALGT